MSYQIKSTPFFQRLLSTSKRNGELQKLKDEYERIKGFDQLGIDKKMREVRLKRLFKEIDDIRENDIKKQRFLKRRSAGGNATTQTAKRKRYNNDTNNATMGAGNNINRRKTAEMRKRTNEPVTPWLQQRQRERQQQRQHQRQLQQQQKHQQRQQHSGIHLSQSTVCPQRSSASNLRKANARPYNSHSKIMSSSIKLSQTSNSNNSRTSYDDDKLSKARVVRRTTYGNQISSWNMQKMLMHNLRRDVKAGIKETTGKKQKYKRCSKPPQKSPKMTKIATIDEKIDLVNSNDNNASNIPKVEVSTRPETPIVEASSKTLVDEELTTTAEINDTKLTESALSIVTLSARSTDNMYSCQSVIQLERTIDIRTIDCDNEFKHDNTDQINSSRQQDAHQQQSNKLELMETEHESQEQQPPHEQQPQKRPSTKNLWNKLAQVVNSRTQSKKSLQILETLEECHNDLENQLRTISNVTNLPQSQIIVRQDDELNLSDPDGYDEDDDVCKAEVLICKNTFVDCIPENVPCQILKQINNYNKYNNHDDDTDGTAGAVSTDTTAIYEDATSKHSFSYQQMSTMMPTPQPAPPSPMHLRKDFNYNPYLLAQQLPQPQTEPQLKSQSLLRQSHQSPHRQIEIDEFLRKCEAISRETVKKEFNEYSVQRLRGIFEHRH